MAPSTFYTRTNGADPAQADKGVWPRFYMDTVPDEFESMRQGRRCYKQEERVEVYMPGNNLHIPVLRVTDEHRQRWAREYEAFKAGMDPAVNGTPIEEWPAINRAQMMELKYLNFRSVEDIANAPDSAIQRIGMGGRILRDRAKAFVDDAERIAVVERQSSELQAVISKNSELELQVKSMNEQMQTLQSRFMDMANAKSPLATMIPGQSDPFEQMKQAGQAPVSAGSALDNIKPSHRQQLKAKTA